MALGATQPPMMTYLYQAYPLPTSKSMQCSGLTFSTFASDGSDLSPYTIYAYDATYVMALALHQLLEVQNRSSVNSVQLMDALVSVTMSGASGRIAFNKQSAQQTTYGEGDRNAGLLYIIQNFQPAYYGSGHNPVRTVGTWASDTNQVTLCDPQIQPYCSPLVYNTIDNSVPVDEAPVHNVQLGLIARSLLRAGAGLVILLIFLCGCMILAFWESRLVKATQPEMLFVILLGALLACLRVIVATMDITDSTCVTGKWLGHLSFALFFGAMILKTWRVDVVTNSGFRKTKFTMATLRWYMGAGLLVFCLYLVIATVVGNPHQSYETSLSKHTEMRAIKCVESVPAVTYFLFGVEALLLLWGARLCWNGKNVPDAINDSKYIAIGEPL